MTDREILEYALEEAERRWYNLYDTIQRLEAVEQEPAPELETEEQKAWLKVRFLEAKLSALPKD